MGSEMDGKPHEGIGMVSSRRRSRRVLSKIQRTCHGEVLSLNMFEECSCGCLHCRYGRRVEDEEVEEEGKGEGKGEGKREGKREGTGKEKEKEKEGEKEGEKEKTGKRGPRDGVWLDWADDVAARLASDLERRRLKGTLPAFVVMGSSCEPFPTNVPTKVKRAALECLEALLRRKVGVSLETRGQIPKEAVELFRAHRRLVRVRVAVPSIDAETVARWEPGAATPEQRLFGLQRLRRAGIPSVLHLAPIVPFVNDSIDHLGQLLDAGADLRVRRVTAEIFKLYPGVDEVLRRYLFGTAQLILGAYLDRTALPPRPRQILPVDRRRRFYDELRKWSSSRGLHLAICSCADSELGSPPCSLGFGTSRRPARRQLGLFGQVQAKGPGENTGKSARESLHTARRSSNEEERSGKHRASPASSAERPAAPSLWDK